MDVLKEIQQAEARARDIEREAGERAKSLAAATTAELVRRRAEGEAALERDLAALRESLARDLEREKAAVAAATRSQIEALASRAANRADAAAAIILAKAGFTA